MTLHLHLLIIQAAEYITKQYYIALAQRNEQQ
ncbi:MAG: hypothetical protein RLZZ540_2945 [Bacteroidota bacterium]